MSERENHFYEFGPFRIDLTERLLLRDGRPVPLTPKAFELLVLLVENSGHVLEKDKLLEAIWPGTFIEEGSLSVNVFALRKALGETSKQNQYIETVPRRGYRFVADVKESWGNNGAKLIAEDDTGADVIIEEEDEAGVEGLIESEQALTHKALTANGEATPAVVPSLPIVESKRKISLGWFLIIPVALAITASVLLPTAIDSNESEVAQTLKPPAVDDAVQLTKGEMGAVKPSFSPDGKHLLYVVNRTGMGDLYVMPAAGGSPFRVTHNAYASGDMPVFTADSTHIVFSSYRSGEDGSRLPDLWIVPSIGSTAGYPKLFIGEASGAGFSPNGKWVAYTKHLPSKKALWVSPINNIEEHIEVSDVGFTPRWSPDGKWIAYTTSEPNISGPGVIWIVPAPHSEGWQLTLSEILSRKRQLTSEPQQMYGLTWTSDSGSLIFAAWLNKPQILWWVPISPGGSAVPLTPGVGSYFSPSVSPDGKILVFCQGRRLSNLVLADGLDSSKLQYITQDEVHLWPTLSPSGGQVASVIQQPDFDEYLYVTDLRTKNRTRLSEHTASHPCWLDEERIAYLQRTPSGDTEVRVANIATGVKPLLTQFAGDARWLAVNPISKRRLAVVLKSPEGRQKIVLKDLDNNSEQTITEGAEYEQLRWLPDGTALSWSGPELSADLRSNGVWLFELNQSELKRIVEDGYSPEWSADGTTLYFSRIGKDSGLYQFDLQRNIQTKVRSWSLVPYHTIVGKRLVFTPDEGRAQIYSMSLRH